MYSQFLPSLGFTPPVTPGTIGYSGVTGAGWTTYDSTQDLIWVANGTRVLGINPLTLSTVVTSATFSSTPQIAYDPTQNRVWVVDTANNSIKAISVSTGLVILTVSLTVSPSCIAYDPVNNNVWYCDSTNTIGRFDAVTGTSVATITYSHLGVAGSMSFDTISNRLWMFTSLTLGNNALTYIPATTNIPIQTGLTDTSIGVGSMNGCSYDPVHNCVWVEVTGIVPGKIIKFDAPSQTTSLTITLGSGLSPYGLALDSGGYVWAATGLNEQKFDPSSGTLLSTASVPANVNISYDSVNHRLWASSTSSPAGLYWQQLA